MGSMMQSIQITACDGLTSATFMPQLGGMAYSIKMPDQSGSERELLYMPEDWQWQRKICGGWPFCFPICGRLADQGQSQYQHDGQQYPMVIHGFAHQQAWQVSAQSSDQIVLQLADNDMTRAIYPFSFELTLDYRIESGQLICQQTYKNTGSQPMPYYAGFHPYFLIDPKYAKQDVQVDMSAHQRVLYNEDLTDVMGQTQSLDFPVGLMEQHVNESLHQVEPGQPIRLILPDGFQIAMSFTGAQKALFRYVQLYHIADQPFFCIEPWMAPPNSMNHSDRLHWLESGQTDTVTLILKAGQG